jgi:hypothetical protein
MRVSARACNLVHLQFSTITSNSLSGVINIINKKKGDYRKLDKLSSPVIYLNSDFPSRKQNFYGRNSFVEMATQKMVTRFTKKNLICFNKTSRHRISKYG